MKIAKTRLKQIIKEELARLTEADWDHPPEPAGSLGGYGDTDLYAPPEGSETGKSGRYSAGYEDGFEGNKFHWASPDDQQDPEYVAGWKEGKDARRIESMRPV